MLHTAAPARPEANPKFDTIQGCEEVISRNRAAFIEAGEALMAIRENFAAWGLKDQHGTFEKYCRTKWGFSRQHASRLIQSSEVVSALSPIGDKPKTESQARELARVPEAKRNEVWQEAAETAPDGNVTANDVRRVVDKALAPADPKSDPGPPPTPLELAMADEGMLVEIQRQLQALRHDIKELADQPIGQFIRRQQIDADLKNVWSAIKFARPHASCPYCNQDTGCDACKSTGWVPIDIYKAAPEEFK